MKHVHTWSSGGLQTHGPEVRTTLLCWARPTYCDIVHESGIFLKSADAQCAPDLQRQLAFN